MIENESAEETRVAWHPAFFDAIRLELEDYFDLLDFESEHQLTAEPLIIDVIIIKKKIDAVIEKNIARIFRRVNIVEYKSPDDSLSVADFHKVAAYAHLYIAQNKIAVTDVSITFAVVKKPLEVMKYMKNSCGFHVSEQEKGIYFVEGYLLPIQIIETKKLSENRWLKDLSNTLTVGQIDEVITMSRDKIKLPYIGAYLYALFKANSVVLKEVREMRENYSFDQFVEEVGLADKWRNEAFQEGLEEGLEKERKFFLELLEQETSIEEIKQKLRRKDYYKG